MTIRKLTKQELALDKARLDAWINELNLANLQAKAIINNHEDKLNDRIGYGDWY